MEVNLKISLIALSLTAVLAACAQTNNDVPQATDGFDQVLTDQANNRFVDKYQPGTLKSIQTPNTVETSIGTLQFIDGAPLCVNLIPYTACLG
jgi:hypothetical protein